MLKLHITAAYTHDGGVASATLTRDIGDDVPQDAVGEAVVDALRMVHERTNNTVPMKNITTVITFQEVAMESPYLDSELAEARTHNHGE